MADQLRASFTVQRLGERRTWRALAYWLLDTCLTNFYLIWRSYKSPDALEGRDAHRTFREELISQIFALSEPIPTPPLTPAKTRYHTKHISVKMPNRGFCAWGTQNINNCSGRVAPGHQKKRKALMEVTGNGCNKPGRKRPKLTHFGCNLCEVHLCVKTGCYDKFHANLHRNGGVAAI